MRGQNTLTFPPSELPFASFSLLKPEKDASVDEYGV